MLELLALRTEEDVWWKRRHGGTAPGGTLDPHMKVVKDKLLRARNTNGVVGFVEAYARTASGGLAIYEGEDFWFTFGPTAHLKQVFDLILDQPFSPDPPAHLRRPDTALLPDEDRLRDYTLVNG